MACGIVWNLHVLDKKDNSMKKLIALTLVSLGALVLPACKSSKPYDSTGAGGPGSEVDYTSMGQLPDRGNFNPETDVDYSVFQKDGSETGIIYFATDSSSVAADQRAKLDTVASWMSENTGKTILIAGHCDERGTLEYNRALGERRSIAVRDYLIGLGVAADRVYTHTYGEEKPAVQGGGDSAWAKNRRAEIGVVTR